MYLELCQAVKSGADSRAWVGPWMVSLRYSSGVFFLGGGWRWRLGRRPRTHLALHAVLTPGPQEGSRVLRKSQSPGHVRGIPRLR